MLEPTDVLTDEQVKKGLRRLIHHGVAIQTMATLTGEAFLVAFALKLGASNLQIGLLAAIGPLAQLLQLPARRNTLWLPRAFSHAVRKVEVADLELLAGGIEYGCLRSCGLHHFEEWERQ